MKIDTLLHIGSRQVLPYEEIMYFQSDTNYTKVFTICGKMIYSSTSLKIIEGRLVDNQLFFRINKGLVINLQHVTAVLDNEVIMLNKLFLPISRRRLYDVQKVAGSSLKVL